MKNLIQNEKSPMNFIMGCVLAIARIIAGVFLICLMIDLLTDFVEWTTMGRRTETTRTQYLQNLKLNSPENYKKLLKTKDYDRLMRFSSEDSVIYFFHFNEAKF